MDIILASASPRRTELLKQIGLAHRILVSDYQEQLDDKKSPAENVAALALEKAVRVSHLLTQGLVIGADTIVVSDERILGKPDSLEAAESMLRALSGRTHQVLTAVAIVDAQGVQASWQCVEVTHVTFRTLDDGLIRWYLSTGESMDKAGAYGIQGFGALLVEKIEGCYFNVVGLPLVRVVEGLERFGVDVYGKQGNAIYH